MRSNSRIPAVVFSVGLGQLLLMGSDRLMADWPQWRGPNRSGFVDSGPLLETLPQQGLQPEWRFDGVSGGNSGGWSSPVVSNNRVYLYSHTKVRNPNVEENTPAKYPWLPPEKRVGMTDEEYAEYEIKRRDENEKQSKAFVFDERLICLDLANGEVVWDRSVKSKYTRFTQSGTPCVSGNRVFVLGAERTARCFDAETGEVVWSTVLPGDFRDEFFASSFVVQGSTALVCCGAMIALDVESGSIRWQGDEPLDNQTHSSPAIWSTPEQPVVVLNARGKTSGYRIADGKKLWTLDSGASQSSPLIAGDYLLTYGSSRKSGLTAFQLSPQAIEKEPELIWQFQRAADSGSSPVVRGDAVFVQGEKRLAKINLADGSTVWQTTMKISNPRYTSLIAAGDQVFFGWEGVLSFHAEGDDFRQIYDAEIDSDGMLIKGEDLRAKLKLNEAGDAADNLAEQEKIWQRNAVQSGPLACSTPAVSDGRLVVRLRDAVVCYDLRP